MLDPFANVATARATLAAGIDALMVLTLVSVWWSLSRAGRDGAERGTFALVLLTALAWGALWTWAPPLAAARLTVPPGGQVMAIAAVLFGCVALLGLPRIRTYFRTADLSLLTAFGVWRIIYGSALLGMGLLGGLPTAFYWSAGLGDIAVGIWGLALLARRPNVSDRDLKLWNVAGLADLAHVLVLGAINLRPFYLSQPDMPLLNLLPLVGVPLFVAVHILSLWGLAARTSQARA